MANKISDLSVGYFPCISHRTHLTARTISLPDKDIPPRLLKQKLSELATLTHTTNHNRSTAINFLHVNGGSLCIVDRRMVEGWECPTPRKKEGNCPGGGNVRGNMSRGECPDPFDTIFSFSIVRPTSTVFQFLPTSRCCSDPPLPPMHTISSDSLNRQQRACV